MAKSIVAGPELAFGSDSSPCRNNAVSRSPSSNHPSSAATRPDATFLWRPSSTSNTENLKNILDCIHPRTDATFLWCPSLHPPHRPIPSFSSVPLYLQQNKKSPAPSKYNTTRHQRKKNKCQADIHNPLRYLLITE